MADLIERIRQSIVAVKVLRPAAGHINTFPLDLAEEAAARIAELEAALPSATPATPLLGCIETALLDAKVLFSGSPGACSARNANALAAIDELRAMLAAAPQPGQGEAQIVELQDMPEAAHNERDRLKPLEAEVHRLREIEHRVWHVLDDSAEDVSRGVVELDLSIVGEDYRILCDLLGDEHPEPGAPRVEAEAHPDTAILDWAETHPEDAMHEISSWWSIAGRGCREVRFSFRNVLRQCMNGSKANGN